MKGPGGLQLGELGQSVAKAVQDDTKKNLKVAASQITGKTFGQSGGRAGGMQQSQQNALDTSGGLGKLLEQNQSQQQPSITAQQQMPRVSREAEFKVQNDLDQKTLAAARSELQKLEQEMAEIKRMRDQGWEERNKEEEEEKKMEDMEEQKQNQQPVRAGSPNPEGGKNKG